MSTELAVILPVAILLLLGLMEGGRIVGAWVILTNEAREAARYGAINDYNVACPDTSAWQSNVTSFAANSVGQMLDTSRGFQVQATLDCSTGIPTSSQVMLTYTLATLAPIHSGIVTVYATSSMRAE